MMSDERVVRSYCRICQAFCGVEATVSEGRLRQIRGDRADPLSKGFACFKGLQAPEQLYGSGRLLSSRRKGSDGVHQAISSVTALAEAGSRLKQIYETSGPEAIAVFMGTQSAFNATAQPVARAFVQAIGTPRLYGTMTIDQSAKWIGEARIGGWSGGIQPFETADVWMFVGSNPLVSMVASGGAQLFIFSDPVKAMKAAKARGTKIIVIDPRRSETADFADLVLQPKPGQDAVLMAAILRVILEKEWHDAPFCRDHVDGLGQLQIALEPFTLDRSAETSGVTAASIVAAAAMFARDARKGMAGSGTGPDMARHSNTSEHLIQALNIVCGRFPRAGEAIANPGALQTVPLRRAQTTGPQRWWDEPGPRSRVHGLGPMKGQMMSATLADEILYQGEGHIRALICVGGNPAVALPDRGKAFRALERLDLLITIDPRMSATARFADYVFAPRLAYERADHTAHLEQMLSRSFTHVTPPIVPAPAGSDLIEDWQVFWSLARDLGASLTLLGHALATDVRPSTEELLAILAPACPELTSMLHSVTGGQLVDRKETIMPPDEKAGRFDLLPDDVRHEIQAVAAELIVPPSGKSRFLLTVRRHREVMNSTGHDLDATRKRFRGAPAFLHPEDIAALGLSNGEMIEIRSQTGVLHAFVAADDRLRRGVVSMAHCWPGVPAQPLEATNELVDSDGDLGAYNRMPVMTAIPVDIKRAGQIDNI